MKRNNRWLILTLITLMLSFPSACASTTIAGDAGTAQAAAVTTQYQYKDLTMQLGATQSEMNFCWYTDDAQDGCQVQVVKKSHMKGADFPSDYKTYTGVTDTASDGYKTNKVTVKGLVASTQYVYRVGDGKQFSEVLSFKTGDSNNYSMIYITDLHMKDHQDNIDNFKGTLDAAFSKFPSTDFMLGGGDIVNDQLTESEYDSLFSVDKLLQRPFMTALGNHESHAEGVIFKYHYNFPNLSDKYGVGTASSDYWFRYGQTLFMVLNTNELDPKPHDEFMKETTAANPDVKWKILIFHQSIYSSGSAHSTEKVIADLRNGMYPAIDKYGIDLVLSGHDHAYTRTYQMYGGKPLKQQTFDSQGRCVDPEGTLYITGDSASLSKYYDLAETEEEYAAVRLQPEVPTFLQIQVSPMSLSIADYRADTMERLDSYSIFKSFADVPMSAWYSNAVNFVAEKSIAGGTGDNMFSPDTSITRGQFIVMLMKACGISPDNSSGDNFSDAGNTYYTAYLAAAKRKGISGGIGDNLFAPESSITRQDMVTLFYNTLSKINKLPTAKNQIDLGSFKDAGSISSYALVPMQTLLNAGLINGSGSELLPQGSSTRAQMAQMIFKMLS